MPVVTKPRVDNSDVLLPRIKAVFLAPQTVTVTVIVTALGCTRVSSTSIQSYVCYALPKVIWMEVDDSEWEEALYRNMRIIYW